MSEDKEKGELHMFPSKGGTQTVQQLLAHMVDKADTIESLVIIMNTKPTEEEPTGGQDICWTKMRKDALTYLLFFFQRIVMVVLSDDVR